jgi:hypothetical protein
MKDYYKSKGEKYETSWSSSLILNIDDASALAQYLGEDGYKARYILQTTINGGIPIYNFAGCLSPAKKLKSC